MIIKVYMKGSKGKWHLYKIIYSGNFEIRGNTLYCEKNYFEYEKIKFHPFFNVVKVWRRDPFANIRSKV